MAVRQILAKTLRDPDMLAEEISWEWFQPPSRSCGKQYNW